VRLLISVNGFLLHCPYAEDTELKACCPLFYNKVGVAQVVRVTTHFTMRVDQRFNSSLRHFRVLRYARATILTSESGYFRTQHSINKKIKMKEPRQVEDTSLFDEILNETPQDVKNFVDNSLEIAHQIDVLMKKKGMLQKDLANLLGKSEAEISRMLSGTHNLTIKSISKIEAVLEAKIITTPFRVEEDKKERK
jgi:antitoxin component HigA of HigAB toxin-antitoxin module